VRKTPNEEECFLWESTSIVVVKNHQAISLRMLIYLVLFILDSQYKIIKKLHACVICPEDEFTWNLINVWNLINTWNLIEMSLSTTNRWCFHINWDPSVCNHHGESNYRVIFIFFNLRSSDVHQVVLRRLVKSLSTNRTHQKHRIKTKE
jgi:hypothetical protein